MYITCRNDQYYLRVRIPSDVQKYFPCSEFKRSLHTDRYKHAKRLAAGLRGKLEEVFTLIRAKVLTDVDIAKIVTGLVSWQVDNFDKGRNREQISTDPELQYENEEYHNHLDSYLAESPGNLELEIQKSESTISDYKRVLALNQAVSFPPAIAWANVSLSKLGIEIDTSSPSYRKLCTEALKGMISAKSIRLEHMQGNFDTDYDKEVRSRPVSDYLSTVLEVKRKGASSIVEDTINKVLDCLEAETGHKDILLSDLSYPLIERINCRLAHYPLRRFQHYPDIPLDEVHQLPHVGYCAPSTCKEDVKRFKALLGNCENYAGYSKFNLKELTKNPALKDTSTGKKREHFYPEDLELIVAELKRRKAKGEFNNNPHLLLIPLIALFQGMRQNEICQLRVSDIMQVDGLWCISVNEDLDEDGTESGKRVKTKNSLRTMPVHPALEELGLIRFWEKQKNKRRVRLWEGEAKVSCELGKEGKHNKLYGQWFQREIRDKIKLEYARRDKQCFHSFRHSFTDWLDKNLPVNHDRPAVVVLTGHLSAEDKIFLMTDTEAYKSYIDKGLPVKRLYKTLQLLDYKLDLSGLAI